MKNISLFCQFILISPLAWAVPTLYPDSLRYQIKNRTDSELVSDTIDRHRYYVLPPRNAISRVRSMHTINANIGFCQEIAQLQDYSRDTVDLLKKIQHQTVRNNLDYADSWSRSKGAQYQLRNLVQAHNLDELKAIDEQVEIFEKRLLDLYGLYRDCRRECEILKADIDATQKFRDDLQRRRMEFVSSRLAAIQNYEKVKAEYEFQSQKATEIKKQNVELYQRMVDIRRDFNHMFDAHAKREGGRVAISFESHWQNNLQRLSADNAHIKFEKIQTQNTQIRTNGYSDSGLAIEGAILKFEFGGMSASQNILKLESYPDSFSGNAVLNLMGACPIIYPHHYDATVPTSIEQMKYGLMVSYDFPTAMRYEVTARYNMYRMFEAIRSQGSRAGFFSSSTWTDEKEQSLFQDSFSVDWKVQDSKQLISEQQKMKIAADLRRQVMSRMARLFVMNHSVTQTLQPGVPPEPGAILLADSISQLCPVNVYCRGASMALHVLQAVFGSSESEQRLLQTVNVNMQDRYSSEQVVMQPMLTAYK